MKFLNNSIAFCLFFNQSFQLKCVTLLIPDSSNLSSQHTLHLSFNLLLKFISLQWSFLFVKNDVFWTVRNPVDWQMISYGDILLPLPKAFVDYRENHSQIESIVSSNDVLIYTKRCQTHNDACRRQTRNFYRTCTKCYEHRNTFQCELCFNHLTNSSRAS